MATTKPGMQLLAGVDGRPPEFAEGPDPRADHAKRADVIRADDGMLRRALDRLALIREYAATERPPTNLFNDAVRAPLDDDVEGYAWSFMWPLWMSDAAASVPADPFAGGPAVHLSGRVFSSHHAAAAYGAYANWHDVCFWTGDGPPVWRPQTGDLDGAGEPRGGNFFHVASVDWPRTRWRRSARLFPQCSVKWDVAWRRMRAAQCDACPQGTPDLAWRLMRGWRGGSATLPTRLEIEIETHQALHRNDQRLVARLALAGETASLSRPAITQPAPDGTVEGGTVWVEGERLTLTCTAAKLVGFVIAKTRECQRSGRGEPGVDLDDIRAHMGLQTRPYSQVTNSLSRANQQLVRAARSGGVSVSIETCGRRRRHAVITPVTASHTRKI